MALELTTDGNTQTATTGDTAVNNSGSYNATLLGATFEWCAGFFGAYVAYTRIVTGVTLDIQTPVSINICAGSKVVIQGGTSTIVGKITETNIQATVNHIFRALNETMYSKFEDIVERTQDIGISTNVIRTLNESGTARLTSYENQETTGDKYIVECTDTISLCVGDSSTLMSSSSTNLVAEEVIINGRSFIELN